MSYRRYAYKTKSSKRMLARKEQAMRTSAMHRTTRFTTTHSLLRRRFNGVTVLVRDDVNFLHTDHRQTDMSHSVNVASVIKFYWLIFYSNGSNRTKRGARIWTRLENSAIWLYSRAPKSDFEPPDYWAKAVPCILDKIVDANGPIGSYLRFSSSGEDALKDW